MLEKTVNIPVKTIRTIKNRNCPLCKHDNTKSRPLRYSDEEWRLKKCSRCDFVYLENVPEYQDLSETFSWEKTSVIRDTERRTKHRLMTALSKKTRWRLHFFKRKKIEDLVASHLLQGIVLDIGCGTGDHLKLLPEHFIPCGIEISQSLADIATKNLSIRNGWVINKPALHGLLKIDSASIDCIIMRAYLEHESQPREVLENVCRVLKPGGIIIIKVPNYSSLNRRIMGKRWCALRFPDHMNYFTVKTLRHMVVQCGFRIKCFSFLDHLPTSDNMWLVGETVA